MVSGCTIKGTKGSGADSYGAAVISPYIGVSKCSNNFYTPDVVLIVGNQTYDGTTPRGVWIYDTSTHSYGPADVIDNYAAMILQKGDVDGDGVVDLADAVLVINHYVGKPVNKFVAKAADVDGDGVVDLADAVRIINFYVGKVQSLAPSRELNGLDPQ